MHQITKLYKSETRKYESLRDKMLSLMPQLLLHYGVKYHKIECRAKGLESLEKKIKSKDDKYSSILEITDLVGLRIITYFEDEVDLVANVIDAEFLVDSENSSDKRILEDDKFGYRSLHKVVKINDKRTDLPEYNIFNDIPFEIQIRSVLQHAWAEIEHDLGYKGEQEIPKEYRRTFYRAAAALESVDVNFTQIRDGLNQYEKDVAIKMSNEHDHSEIDINQASLNHFINDNEVLKALNEVLINEFGTDIYALDKGLRFEIKRMAYFGIYSISDLEIKLSQSKEELISFVKEFFTFNSLHGQSYSDSIGIFHFGYLLALKSNDRELLEDYIDNNIGGVESISELVNELLEIYERSKRSII